MNNNLSKSYIFRSASFHKRYYIKLYIIHRVDKLYILQDDVLAATNNYINVF
jgi:sulfur transfer complex TusBCD TusB component (DsrH family)